MSKRTARLCDVEPFGSRCAYEKFLPSLQIESKVGAGLFPFLNAAGGVSSLVDHAQEIDAKLMDRENTRITCVFSRIRFETRFGKVDIRIVQ